jgi:hypothetical protein
LAQLRSGTYLFIGLVPGTVIGQPSLVSVLEWGSEALGLTVLSETWKVEGALKCKGADTKGDQG